MQRMRALSGDPALRCPKWAAAKRAMNPSMQKPLMALSQKPKHEKGSQPITKRHCWATWPCSSMTNTGDHMGRPVQPEKMLR